MRTLRIALAQINTTVGDLDGNTAKVIDYTARARDLGADIVAFPELAITGYPPEDLLFKHQFIEDNRARMCQVVEASEGIASVVGFVDSDADLHNAAAIAHDGRLAGVYLKMFPPNYGVLDEERYFKAGRECPVYVIGGVRVGVNVCEDIWQAVGPTVIQRAAGAEVHRQHQRVAVPLRQGPLAVRTCSPRARLTTASTSPTSTSWAGRTRLSSTGRASCTIPSGRSWRWAASSRKT